MEDSKFNEPPEFIEWLSRHRSTSEVMESARRPAKHEIFTREHLEQLAKIDAVIQLRLALASSGMSQKQLADSAGMSRQQVSSLLSLEEPKNIKITTITRLFTAMNQKGEMFSRESDPSRTVGGRLVAGDDGAMQWSPSFASQDIDDPFPLAA